MALQSINKALILLDNSKTLPMEFLWKPIENSVSRLLVDPKGMVQRPLMPNNVPLMSVGLEATFDVVKAVIMSCIKILGI